MPTVSGEPAEPAEADDLTTRRRAWMAVLARAPASDIARLLEQVPELPPHSRLRGPECGLVMVRGRVGGGGGPFNLGEMAVTRCSVRLADGTVGHAYVTGRDAARAELAARLDAALQDKALGPVLKERVIAPLAAAQHAARQASASRAAATQVQFFTMATMRTDTMPTETGRTDMGRTGTGLA